MATVANLYTVFSTFKSGGSLLSLGMKNIANNLCHEHIFAPDEIELSPDSPDIPLWTIAHRDSEVNLFKQYIQSYPYGGITHLGYRIDFDKDLADAILDAKTDDSKKILFKRKDKLRIYLGHLYNNAVNYTQLIKGAEYTLPDYEFTIVAGDMLTYFQADDDYYTNAINDIIAAEKTYHEVTYEDFINDVGTTRADILSYLGLAGTIEMEYVASPEKPLSDLITNYAEIETAILGSAWAGDIDLS